MSDAAANFEKFFAGEPLTIELAALRDGRQDAPVARGDGSALPGGFAALLEALGPRQLPSSEDDRPLSRDEQLALKEAQQGGGVTTLTRLLRKSLHAKIKMAILDSENDPLGRSVEIAQQWAYITVYRRLIKEVEIMVKAAIEDLEQERGQ